MKTFDVYSGQIRVSDPCYGKNLVVIKDENKIPNILNLKAKKGRWVAEVVKDERVYNEIITSIVAYYDESLSKSAGLEDISTDFHKALSMMMAKDTAVFTTNEMLATVESGVIGIFDDKSYRDDRTASRANRLCEKIVCEDEPWYSICCDRVLSEDQWGVVPNGCVTSSSKDGDVRVVTQTNSYGEVVKVEIDFQAKVEETPSDSSYEDEDEEEEEEEEYESECDCAICRGEVDSEDDEDEEEEESEDEEDEEDWVEVDDYEDEDDEDDYEDEDDEDDED